MCVFAQAEALVQTADVQLAVNLHVREEVRDMPMFEECSFGKGNSRRYAGRVLADALRCLLVGSRQIDIVI